MSTYVQNIPLQSLKAEQDAVFMKMAQVMAIMGAPVRLKLLHFLSQSPLSVEVLAQKIQQSVANTSMHLRKMLAEDIVTVEGRGQRRLYALHPALQGFWESSQDFIQQVHPELRIARGREELSWTLPLAETLSEIADGRAIALDVRPADEVVPSELSEHDGFVHIPHAELEAKSAQLPRDKKILVFCRGRFCALSTFVVNTLRQKGFDAYRLPHSWFEISTLVQQKGKV